MEDFKNEQISRPGYGNHIFMLRLKIYLRGVGFILRVGFLRFWSGEWKEFGNSLLTSGFEYIFRDSNFMLKILSSKDPFKAPKSYKITQQNM